MTTRPGESSRSAREVEALVAQLGTRLEGAGIRVSRRRRVILEALAAEDGHLTPEELAVRLRDSGDRISLTTIYRFLRVLASQRVVRTIRVGDTTRFEVDDGEHHHDHLLCGGCGRILEVDDDVLRRCVRALTAAHGFEGGEPTVEIRATCTRCPSAADPVV